MPPLYQFVHRIVYQFKRGPSYRMTTLSQLSPFVNQNHWLPEIIRAGEEFDEELD